jgi:hypothetical protein
VRVYNENGDQPTLNAMIGNERSSRHSLALSCLIARTKNDPEEAKNSFGLDRRTDEFLASTWHVSLLSSMVISEICKTLEISFLAH